MLSFRILPLAAVLLVATLRAQITTVFDDSFADGERSIYSLPGSIAWYQNVPGSAGNTQAGKLAVRNGALVFMVNNESRALWTYFPKVSLKAGERITLLMDFRFTAPVANGFRIGICNTNGVAPQIGDGPGPTGAYQGYGLENLFVIKRSGPAASDPDGALLNLNNAAGQTIWDRVSPTARGIQGVPFQANTLYTLVVNIVRTGADTATLATALTGGGLTNTNTATVTDSANILSTFDTFGIAFVGNALSGDMIIEHAAVVTTGEVTQVNPARLINLSILTTIPTSGDFFTMGYVVGGAGTSGSKPLVIRAAGPTLGAAPFNIPGALDDPKLELFTGSAKTGENDNWGGGADVSAAMAAVGAFGFSGPTSRDAAVVTNVDSGASSSVKVSANGSGTGTVIAEIYDASPSGAFRASTPRLINVSVLKHLGTGLTAGFVVGGSGVKTVLIRAIGPTLGADPFKVPGVVADPRLAVFNSSSTQIAANDNWGGDAALAAAFTKVGAFGLPANSLDAALLTTLQPGNYTVQVSGVNNTTGVALVEVYEVP